MNTRRHLIWAVAFVAAVSVGAAVKINHDKHMNPVQCQELFGITPEKYKWASGNQ